MQKQSRLKKAFLSSVTSALYQIATIICGFVTSKLIIQSYGSSWNGVLNAVTKFLALFTILESGINGSTRVALYRAFAKNDMASVSSVIKANDSFYKKISLFLIFYVAVLAILIPNIVISDQANWMIALMVIIVGLSNFAENCWGINSKLILISSQNRYILNTVQAISVVINAIMLVVIVNLNGSIFATRIGMGLIHTLVPVVIFIISRRMFKIDKHAKPDNTALKGRWDVIANSVSNIVHENVDVFFLAIFCAATEISVYSLYYVVAGGITRIFYIIMSGMEAGFGDMWAKGEVENIQKSVKKFEYIMYSLSTFLFGCMMVLIVPFMSVYIPNVNDVNYQRPILSIVIAIAQILMCTRTPYVLLVQAAGHYKQVKIGAFIETGINIVLTLILVTRFGIVGAIVGTIVANAFRTIQYGWYVSKHMISRNFRQILLRLIWSFGVLFGGYFVSRLCISVINITGWISWIIAAIIAFVVYAFIILVASLIFYNSDLKQFVDLFFTLFKRKKGGKS